jgi:hypothetical protein
VTDLDWLSEVNDKITRVCLYKPAADEILKHVRHRVLKALREERVDEDELRLIKGMLTVKVVNYQDLEEDFFPTLQKMSQLEP